MPISPQTDTRLTVRILPRNGDPIVAYAPETLRFGGDAEWSPVYGNVSVMGGKIGAGVQSALGIAFVNQAATAKVWSGMRGFSIPQLTLNFIAETDAKQDVWIPVARLWKLTLPTSRTGYSAVPPGPALQALSELKQTASGQSSSIFDNSLNVDGVIGLQVGNVFNIPSIVITKFACTYPPNQPDPNGYPIWADVTLDIASYKEPFSGDVNQIMGLSEGEAPGKVTSS